MKIKTKWIALAGCLVALPVLLASYPRALESRSQGQSGLYLGQEPPGTTPVVFAPVIVSTGDHEFSCTFTPDLSEFYFARGTGPNNRKQILVTRMQDGIWSDPAPALPSFASECFEPHITPDGSKIFFMGFHIPEGQDRADIDMFCALRDGDTWGEIRRLGEPFNPMNSMTPCTMRDGTLYTCSKEDIVRSRLVNGEYQPFENLGAPINTGAFEGYPYVSPDGDYLIFARMQEGMPLFVSFREGDGSWGDLLQIPLGMPAGIPSVSPDGKYLFFVAGRPGDIYWVDARIFKDLRPL